MAGVLEWLVDDANNGGVLGTLAMMQPKFQAGLLNQQKISMLQQEQQQAQQERAQAGAGVRQLLGRPVEGPNELPWLNPDQPVKLGAAPADGLLKMYGENAEPVRRLLGAVDPTKALGVLTGTAKSSADNTEWSRRQEVEADAAEEDRNARFGQQTSLAKLQASLRDDAPFTIDLPGIGTVATSASALRKYMTGPAPGDAQPPAPLAARAGGPTMANDAAARAEAPPAAPPNPIRTIAPGMVTLSGPKPTKAPSLPAGMQKAEDEDIEAIQTATGISRDLGVLGDQIATGKLKLGPLTNAQAAAQNYLGMSDADSQNYASFKATLEKMRNDSLRLNKGVQTEGDAQRAWNELFASTNDPAVVGKRLQEIQAINERAVQMRSQGINLRRKRNMVEPLDVSQIVDPIGASIGATAKRPGTDTSAGTADAPPVQGARKAPDGHWYVQQGARFFRVDP
jgi:hypothetical protein